MIVLPLFTIFIILLIVYFYLKCDITNECINTIEPVNVHVPTPTPIEKPKVKVEPEQVVSNKTKKSTTKKTKKSKTTKSSKKKKK